MKRFIFMGVLLLGLALSHGVYAAAATEDPDAKNPEFEYIELDPIHLPIITARGITQQVSMTVKLEVDFGKKDEISNFKPRLADAYIQDLYGALGTGHAFMKGNIVDVVQIKQRLSFVTEKVLGPDHKVREVLLQIVQQRPM